MILYHERPAATKTEQTEDAVRCECVKKLQRAKWTRTASRNCSVAPFNIHETLCFSRVCSLLLLKCLPNIDDVDDLLLSNELKAAAALSDLQCAYYRTCKYTHLQAPPGKKRQGGKRGGGRPWWNASHLFNCSPEGKKTGRRCGNVAVKQQLMTVITEAVTPWNRSHTPLSHRCSLNDHLNLAVHSPFSVISTPTARFSSEARCALSIMIFIILWEVQLFSFSGSWLFWFGNHIRR